MRDSAQLFSMVHQALVAAGVDYNAVYTRLGYRAETLEPREQRTPHRMQVTFWECVEAVTGDPDIGLHLCPHLPPYRGEILEYLMFSSRTLGEGAQRAQKYLRLVSDALQIRMLTPEDGGQAHLRLTASAVDAPQMRHTEICVTYELVRFIRDMSDGQVTPRAVRLRWQPIAASQDYTNIFGCPVEFAGRDDNEIEWRRNALEYRSPRWDPELLRLHEQYADRRLAELERQDLIGHIRKILARRLELGGCDLPLVAGELGVTPRRLRVELTQAGTSFSEVLADFRYALARRLLADSDERIEDIVYLTGFSEPSTFYRAFKRWSGLTPAQYREQHHRAAPPAN